jgi:hypothetical protein
MSLNFIKAWRNDKWYNKRVLIWCFTLVLIKINYGQIGDQTGLFYTTNPVFYSGQSVRWKPMFFRTELIFTRFVWPAEKAWYFFGLVNRESLPDWMSGKVRQTFVISAHYPDSKQTWVFSNSLILCGCHRNNNLILLGFTRLGIPPTIYRIFKTSMPSIIPPLQRQ